MRWFSEPVFRALWTLIVAECTCQVAETYCEFISLVMLQRSLWEYCFCVRCIVARGAWSVTVSVFMIHVLYWFISFAGNVLKLLKYFKYKSSILWKYYSILVVVRGTSYRLYLWWINTWDFVSSFFGESISLSLDDFLKVLPFSNEHNRNI